MQNIMTKFNNTSYIILLLCIFIFCDEVQGEIDEISGCLYRDFPVRMPPHIFSYWGCWGCYDYLNRYKSGMKIIANFKCREEGYKVPCFNESIYFDYHNNEIINMIGETLISNRDIIRWLDCCTAADSCCERIQEKQSQLSNSTECHALWDGWECWEEEKPHNFQLASCPVYIYSGSGPSCDLHSEKECFLNGTWNVNTDYTTCSQAPRLKFRHYYHVSVLGVAIATSIPALVIFIYYRRLRNNTRVILHRNLLIAIILRNTLVIIVKCLVIIDELYATSASESAMSGNSGWCRTLVAFEKFATNSVFACMTLESVYLHRVLARAFKSQPNMTIYYLVAASVCAICVVTWASLMATMNDFYCWTLDYNDLDFHWINDSLRLVFLCVNLLLLLDIVRVLLTRLRSVHTVHSSRIRRTAKATLLLAPVFGVQFLVTAIRPETRDCGAEQAYYIASYTLEALQGPLVAALYCYFNNEVRRMVISSLERQFGPLGRKIVRPSIFTDVTDLPPSQKAASTKFESHS